MDYLPISLRDVIAILSVVITGIVAYRGGREISESREDKRRAQILREKSIDDDLVDLKEVQQEIKGQIDRLRDEMDKQFAEMSKFYGELSADMRALFKLTTIKNPRAGD